MSDDADDVDADGADDNVGDNDGVFFSPELAQDNGLAENKTRPRGHRKRHPGPPPEAGTPGHAFTMGPLLRPWQRPTQLVRGLLRPLLLAFVEPLPWRRALGAATKAESHRRMSGSRRLRPGGSRGANLCQ